MRCDGGSSARRGDESDMSLNSVRCKTTSIASDAATTEADRGPRSMRDISPKVFPSPTEPMTLLLSAESRFTISTFPDASRQRNDSTAPSRRMTVLFGAENTLTYLAIVLISRQLNSRDQLVPSMNLALASTEHPSSAALSVLKTLNLFMPGPMLAFLDRVETVGPSQGRCDLEGGIRSQCQIEGSHGEHRRGRRLRLRTGLQRDFWIFCLEDFKDHVFVIGFSVDTDFFESSGIAPRQSAS